MVVPCKKFILWRLYYVVSSWTKHFVIQLFYMYFQRRNFKAAFEAAESVGIPPILVSLSLMAAYVNVRQI